MNQSDNRSYFGRLSNVFQFIYFSHGYAIMILARKNNKFGEFSTELVTKNSRIWSGRGCFNWIPPETDCSNCGVFRIGVNSAIWAIRTGTYQTLFYHSFQPFNLNFS